MTEDQKNKLMKLVYAYGSARENLGTVPSSLYWNSANREVEQAEKEIDDYLATIK